MARLILREISERLRFLENVGIGYLSMDRAAATLSGGEAQRIRLATQIGSSLVGVLYILDEPSIGLHQRDNSKLIATLERLRDLGNTVIVVEHDEQTMRAADHLVDLGPGAGEHGGRIVAAGHGRGGAAGAGVAHRPVPLRRPHDRDARPSGGPRAGYIEILGATQHNLRDIDVHVPLGGADVRDGGLRVGQVDARQRRPLQGRRQPPAPGPQASRRHRAIHGLEQLDKIIAVDQSPIGRTPRSNPATYTGLFDVIRDLFSKTQEARARGYKPGRFSFNVKGGRCEVCRGDGQIKIEMHFLPDVYVPCEQCHGKRYNRETLEVRFKGRSIADVLDMPVEEALSFFEHIPKVRRRLETLDAVGLGYVRLGQPATTLSGGEAQRVKLATELSKIATGRTLYILDEPTTGPALRRRPAPAGGAPAARRRGQQRGRDRAQPRRDQVRRPDDRHGPRGGRGGRDGDRRRHPRGGRRSSRPRTPGGSSRSCSRPPPRGAKPPRNRAQTPRQGRRLSTMKRHRGPAAPVGAEVALV